MANYNCDACNELRENAPNFTQNGLTDTECNSLKNDTGLNPSNRNNDCIDLENMNDCLIGNMDSEIELYDVCDWKDYMKKYVGNSWTMFKGIICTICGLWANVHNLWSKANALCALIDALIDPPLQRYGTLLNDYGAEHPANRGGTIGTKNNKPVVVPMAQSEVDEYVWKAQSVGIYHGKQRMTRCSDGGCQSYEWIAPNFAGYRVNPEVSLSPGDVIWSATKAECMAWGISEDMWQTFTVSSWTWYDYAFAGSPRSLAWFRLSVENNVLELSYRGQVGDTDTSNKPINEPSDPSRRYIYSC